MKYKSPLIIVVFLLVCHLVPTATAQPQITYSVSGSGRYHKQSPSVPEVPFEDGDWSAMLGLELYEGLGYLQLAVDFADGTGSTNDIDRVTTPQINLMFADKGLVAGAGILKSYVEDNDAGDDWTDLYYQTILGVNLPIGRSLSLHGLAHYIFKDWDGLGDFDFDEVEFSVGLSFRF